MKNKEQLMIEIWGCKEAIVFHVFFRHLFLLLRSGFFQGFAMKFLPEWMKTIALSAEIKIKFAPCELSNINLTLSN